MRPWQHAKSSAGKGGCWQADLPVHEFLDSTKASCADRRHRAVLHHVDLGAALAARAFPNRTDIGGIVARHVVEDLGAAATLWDWFDCCDVARLPSPMSRRLSSGQTGVVDLVCGRLHPSLHDAVEDVADLLFLPGHFVPTHPDKALAILMNAAGPMIVRRILGPPAERVIDGQTRTIDWGWIAEAVIFTSYGRIMDLCDVVRCWSAEPRARDHAAE